MKEGIYWCIGGLDGRIVSMKYKKAWFLILLAGKMVEAMIWHTRMLLPSQPYTDGAWWKMKKCCHQKDVSNYPDGCNICLKSFSVWLVSTVNKSTQIKKIKWNEQEEERNKCMVWSIQVIFNFWLRLIAHFVLLWCISHCIFLRSGWHKPINPS